MERCTTLAMSMSLMARSFMSSSVSTWTLASLRSSSIWVFDPRKSNRVPISFLTWLTALSISCMSTRLTTSKDGILFPP